jgi:hypothetical protein
MGFYLSQSLPRFDRAFLVFLRATLTFHTHSLSLSLSLSLALALLIAL